MMIHFQTLSFLVFLQGDDSVTECVHNNGDVQVFNSYNPGAYNTRLTNVRINLIIYKNAEIVTQASI